MIISEDTVEALQNELTDILEMIGPFVKFERLKAPLGSLCLWRFTVNVRTYYISAYDDTDPKPTDQIIFMVDIKEGWPGVAPRVYYEQGKVLASVNVFPSGAQCIDKYIFDAQHAGLNTTLSGIVRKTLKDIIHIPSVTRYDSPANSALIPWQKKMTESGKLPSCEIERVLKVGQDSQKSVYIPELPDLPVRKIVRRRPNLPDCNT